MILYLYKEERVMEKILNVAKYLCDSYAAIAGEKIDEMKLHKLLYFIQRESYAIKNEPLFEEAMEGWVHGPVSTDVRKVFYDGDILCYSGNISLEAERIVNGIIEEYGSMASWKLRDLSHCEISWKNSRTGLKHNEIGSKKISLKDIKIDSDKVRPFDHVWGMYYDEFEDADEEVRG